MTGPDSPGRRAFKRMRAMHDPGGRAPKRDMPDRLRYRAEHVEALADETHRPRKMLNAAQVMREAADLIEAKSERIRVLEARLAEMGGAE